MGVRITVNQINSVHVDVSILQMRNIVGMRNIVSVVLSSLNPNNTVSTSRTLVWKEFSQFSAIYSL